MKEYDVIVLDEFYFGLKDIINFKVEKSQTVSGAIKFRDATFEEISNLRYFPQIGKNLMLGNLAKVVMGHLLVYRIEEESRRVFVTDVIDPQQHTRAGKYY